MKRKNILIFILCFSILIGSSKVAMSGVKLDPQYQYVNSAFEYDDNVTREWLRKDYQHGFIWRLNAGFGIRDFIPIKGLNSSAGYTLGMRDVINTNIEDFNSHEVKLGADVKLGTGSTISLNERLKIWNSLSDLFNFRDNAVEASIEQPFGKNTSARLAYKNEQKWFQNKAPEVQARNFFYNQVRIDISHSISSDFTVQLGYADQFRIYNRSPIDFKGGKQIALKGVLQKDRQKIIILGFHAGLFNNTNLTLLNQIVKSDSNSRVFDFNGNRTQIVLLSNPLQKFWVELSYQLAAYNLGAYQTPDLGYELSEARTDDQSGIKIGITYDISDQVSLKLNYEHIENTVFFTKEFYKENTTSIGMNVKF